MPSPKDREEEPPPPKAEGELAPEPGEGKGVLVLGGGIAGIQAALDLADARVKVYLVERGPSIGGRMSQLDKTFPTMDCSI
ncbi:MAG TPA: FAD-dependent oxidoreductase [bacterium]|nr:FAD-dependent oxidoreductase [bacterium]